MPKVHDVIFMWAPVPFFESEMSSRQANGYESNIIHVDPVLRFIVSITGDDSVFVGLDCSLLVYRYHI